MTDRPLTRQDLIDALDKAEELDRNRPRMIPVSREEYARIMEARNRHKVSELDALNDRLGKAFEER